MPQNDPHPEARGPPFWAPVLVSHWLQTAPRAEVSGVTSGKVASFNSEQFSRKQSSLWMTGTKTQTQVCCIQNLLSLNSTLYQISAACVSQDIQTASLPPLGCSRPSSCSWSLPSLLNFPSPLSFYLLHLLSSFCPDSSWAGHTAHLPSLSPKSTSWCQFSTADFLKRRSCQGGRRQHSVG